VGGQLAEDGAPPVILSLERMRAIRSFDAVAGTMTVEAGAILADIHAAAEAEDLIFPLTLASQGSARIGGLLATNAGGVNVLRYGNARDLCLGIEAVLPDGSVMNALSGLRKNNMGYDLRHLLIGAEGTLGVITAATLRLFPKPATTGAALMVVPDPDAALGLLRLTQARVGAGLSAFEIMHRMGLDFLREVGPEIRHPFDDPPEWMCLIDLGMGAGDRPEDALETLFAEAFEAGLVTDGLIAQSEAQRAEFWTLRETIPLANRRIGAGSTASAIWATATCTTTSSPCRAERARTTRRSAPRIKRRPRPRARDGRLGFGRARDRAAEGGRPGALRRSGEAGGDAGDQGRAGPAGDHEPRRGAADFAHGSVKTL
jgi:FAD/FMN-containing dehydrogenase